MKRFLYILFLCMLLSGTAGAVLLPTQPGDSGTDDGIQWEAYVLKDGDTPESLFKKLANDVIRLNRMATQFWTPGTVIKKPIQEDYKKLKGWTPMPKKYKDCKGKNINLCIVVVLSKQFLGVYRKGKLKRSYPVSTGIPDYETPTGKFTVKPVTPGKNIKIKKIFSYTYRTWMYWPLPLGHELFIHAGDLPGYPASHGCIRLMRKSAYKVFRMTPLNTPVVILP